MKPERDKLVACLEKAGSTAVPPPRERFVRHLEARLVARSSGEEAVVEEPPARRTSRPPRAIAWLAPVAAALALAVVAVSTGDGTRRVDTVGRPTSSTSAPTTTTPATVPTTLPTAPAITAVPPPETTVPPVPTTAGRVPVPVTTRTTAPKPTTTTTAAPKPEPPATTVPPVPTTAPTAAETPALECRPGSFDGKPGVACSWSASPSAEFAGYRLLRKDLGGAETKVFATADRQVVTFVDHAVVPGATYAYVVEVKSRAGTVVARSGPVTVVCCA